MDQVTKRYFALLNEVFCAMRMTGCVRRHGIEIYLNYGERWR